MELKLMAVKPITQPDIADIVEKHKLYDTTQVVANGNHVMGAEITINDKAYWVSEPRDVGFIVKVKYEEDTNELDPVLREWGPHDQVCRMQTDAQLQRWIRTNSPLETTVMFRLLKRIACFDPFRSKEFPGKISITRDVHAYYDNKQTAMTPARAFQFMFPEFDHKTIIRMTDDYLNTFCQREFTLHVGSSADDFTLAYSGQQCMRENVSTSAGRKHIADSCMRYEFEHLPCHPTTAYASDDFNIIYLTDQHGKIGGRCVVYVNHPSGIPQAGPIYGVSEQAIDMIGAKLYEMEAEFFHSADWGGARLKRIEYDNHSFIGPYLDVHPQSLDDNGNHLIVCKHGGIDASVYQGIYNEFEYHCENCECGLHPDDSYYSEDTSCTYCESCFYDEHFYCDYSQCDVHRENGIEVWVSGWNNSYSTQLVDRDYVYGGNDFLKCTDGEWWDMDLTTYCEYEDSHISPEDLDGYFTCDEDGELYPNSHKAETVCGKTVALHHMDEGWQLQPNGKWEMIQNEMEL